MSVLKNMMLCAKYPFLHKKGTFKETWYDDIPEGWRNTFGEQLCKDLKEAIKEAKKEYKKELHIRAKTSHVFILLGIDVVKGSLEFNGFIHPIIRKVLLKYKNLSKAYCLYCGQPVRYKMEGTEEYLCKNCAKNFVKTYHGKTLIDQKKYLSKCRLTKKDIPINSDTSVNFIKAWDLKSHR